MTRSFILAGVVAALASPLAAFAQGKSQSPNNPPPSQAPKNNPPPSRNDLPASATSPGMSFTGATPFAWVDDATVLAPRTLSVAMSAARWQGSESSEVDVPVVDVAIGLAPRVHLTATIPRVVGSADASGAAGGVGTSYFSAKIAVLNGTRHGVKVSVAPMLEVLGRGVLQSSLSDERRAHFGFPVSAEINVAGARVYGGTGYFSRGVWFAGGGAGFRVSRKAYATGGFSRSWRAENALNLIPDRVRNDLTGSASYAIVSNVSVYGSIGRTIATLDENGAGTTIGGGIAFFFTPPVK